MDRKKGRERSIVTVPHEREEKVYHIPHVSRYYR